MSVDDRAIELGPARQRCVLAALAVDVDHVVSVDRLIQRVWGQDPPLRARATLSNYLSRLRHALAGLDAVSVVRRSGGYLLAADPAAIDRQRFHDLCAAAHTCAGHDRRVAELLAEALGLWRGDALTGLGGEWAEVERNRLHQARLNAEGDYTEALLRLGHGEDLVAGLSARTAEYPLDERVAAQYMLALYRSGRVADALNHYLRIRTHLLENLGVDPEARLCELHRQILAADPTLAAPLSAPLSGRVAAPAVEVPQLLSR
ncbi:BTAD domain-containing putative transcriptional regulator [Amycolatopsis sp. NPDC059021]|uniref:AfsR/SARP family transcriptional regulator n=1 Tax=Amycolatopsis sp. NPDC059021 TaxID=3346704 RepID=UPI0036733D6D